MLNANVLLDRQYLQMRERILSLAADFDRIERGTDGRAVLQTDPRAVELKRAMEIVLTQNGNRAEQVQMLLSDRSPAPVRPTTRVTEQPAKPARNPLPSSASRNHSNDSQP